MQKLTIKEKINEFSSVLKTDEIRHTLRLIRGKNFEGQNDPQKQKAFKDELDKLVQLIINSKVNYDNIVLANPELTVISNSINSNIYNTEYVSKLLSDLTKTDYGSRKNIYNIDSIFEFLLFHDSIDNLKKVVNAAITESQEEENIIIFTLISVENPLVSLLVEILTKISDLIDLVEKFYEEEQENKIYILDKGSNTNIGIETGIQTARSIFQIFKEVWDWVANKNFYKQKIRNAAFLENLEVLNKIKESKDNGAISEEDANRYKELIIKKTDELLSLNAVPRKILLESNKTENEQLLLGYNEVRLLQKGEDNT